jgi:hypothetical protein
MNLYHHRTEEYIVGEIRLAGYSRAGNLFYKFQMLSYLKVSILGVRV